jgi:hypothetical protein
MDLLGLSTKFLAMALEVEVLKHEALEEAVKIALEGVKARPGHYNGASGPTSAWESLSPATMESREQLGFEPDDPLLRTGALRDSYVGGVEGDTGFVGSPLDEAAYTEFGTSTQPPRSILVGGFFDKEKEILAKLGETTVKVLFK